MASVSGVPICPFCKFEYEHRTRLPDVCTSCFQVINVEPKSEVFATPDYLYFQYQDSQERISKLAKPMASSGEEEAVTSDDSKMLLNASLNTELYSFLTTCSFETVKSAMKDAELFISHLIYSNTLQKDQIASIAKAAQKVGELAKGVLICLENGGANLYEYRQQTTAATKLGAGSRTPSDSIEERD